MNRILKNCGVNFERRVLIGVKLDAEKEYLYVSTMHDVQEAKITRRLHSGRIKAFSVDNVGQE